ncbi:MAG: serine/threonine-protein kinase [Pirellulaceae bacterium]
MHDSPLPDDAVSPEQEAEIHAICDRFAQRWRTPPRIEEFLVEAAAEHRAALFYGLLCRELELRRSGGQVPELDEYQARFPNYLTQINAAFEATCALHHNRESIPARDAAPPDSQRHADENATNRSVSTVNTDSTPSPPWILTDESSDDFKFLRTLGRGASGEVLLAWQQSLSRRVAVKRTQNVGSEARTMAQLEHPRIVRVYSESIDELNDTRLICMQYVPGPTLADVLKRLKDFAPAERSGKTFLQAIDELAAHDESLDAEGLRERQLLASLSWTEVVCRLVAGLAEALHFAHRHGVLHRDIKPANILLDPYGRAMLADFSLSFTSLQDSDDGEPLFGGTLSYMAPEHLDAFGSHDPVQAADAVDERSDIFSLGIVLYEALALRRPWSTRTQNLDRGALAQSAQQRRQPPPSLLTVLPELSYAVDQTVQTCLAGEPSERFQDAGRLAAALAGCEALERARRRLPSAGAITQALEHLPLLGGVATALSPHLVGNVMAAGFLALAAFPRLDASERVGYLAVAVGYGLAAFSLTGLLVAVFFGRATSVSRRLKTGRIVDRRQVERGRRQALRFPRWSILISCGGWLPVLVVVPVGLAAVSGGITPGEYAVLAVSVIIGLLVATPYCYFLLQHQSVRLLYPLLWSDAADFTPIARRELAYAAPWMRGMQIISGLAPLAGAVLLVLLGPNTFLTGGYLEFRLFTATLIVLGMAGIPLCIRANRLITESIDVFTQSHDSSDAERSSAAPQAQASVEASARRA